MPPKRKHDTADASSTSLAAVKPEPHEDEPPAKRTRTRTGAIKNIKKAVEVVVPARVPAKRGRPRKAATTTTATTTTKAKGKGKAKAEPSPSPSPPPSEASSSSSSSSSSSIPFVPPQVPAPAPPRAKPTASSSRSKTIVIPPRVPARAATAAKAPAKRVRKKKVVVEPDADGRLARFKTHPTREDMDRVHRVYTQRIFMVDRHREGDELKETFQVLGSTGNVYTVTIDVKPKCNCPDAYTQHHCKHMIFVFLKVLQVSRDSHLWYQKGSTVYCVIKQREPPICEGGLPFKQYTLCSARTMRRALLKSELAEIFAHAPLAPNSLAHPKIREAYARATGQAVPEEESAEEAAEEGGRRKIPGEDDDCPICYDTMYQVVEKNLVWCEECGNGVHKECWAQWQRTSTNQGKKLTCVWCRADWTTAAKKKAAGAGGAGITPKKIGSYFNFAGVPEAGVSRVRDTSTYYQGPRRGQRYYGYQDYDD